MSCIGPQVQYRAKISLSCKMKNISSGDLLYVEV